MAGSASVSQAILMYLRFKKPVVKLYTFFLVSLFCFLLAFLTDLYSSLSGLSATSGIESLNWLFQAAGIIIFFFCAPYFYHTLLGLELGPVKKVFFFSIDSSIVIAVVTYIFIIQITTITIILNLLLLAMIGYGLILILIHWRRIADTTLKKAIRVFFFLSLIFFPFFYLDVLVSNYPAFSIFGAIDNLSLPLYFLILNMLTLWFALSYLNHPPYREEEHFTNHFIDTFQITPREEEVINLLLTGSSNREISDTLFISPKTVENHLYNIYQKVGVNNRVQLFQLIRINSL
jgi:DNA-binding CsgD family transcriptional regulator